MDNKKLMTSNSIMVWFYDGERWFTSLTCQLKRIFQSSPSSPHRLMIRHIFMRDDNPVQIFQEYERTKQIEICYVEISNLLDPDRNVIIAEFQVSELKRHWLSFNKRADRYYEDVFAPFFEFEGVFRPVDKQPFAPVFYGKTTGKNDG